MNLNELIQTPSGFLINVLFFFSHLVNLLGSHVVGSEPEDLGEVTEGPVHVVLVVKAETSHYKNKK